MYFYCSGKINGLEAVINGKKGTFFKGSHSCNIKMKLLSFFIRPVYFTSGNTFFHIQRSYIAAVCVIRHGKFLSVESYFYGLGICHI